MAANGVGLVAYYRHVRGCKAEDNMGVRLDLYWGKLVDSANSLALQALDLHDKWYERRFMMGYL